MNAAFDIFPLDATWLEAPPAPTFSLLTYAGRLTVFQRDDTPVCELRCDTFVCDFSMASAKSLDLAMLTVGATMVERLALTTWLLNLGMSS
jgi:hypothetical protein